MYLSLVFRSSAKMVSEPWSEILSPSLASILSFVFGVNECCEVIDACSLVCFDLVGVVVFLKLVDRLAEFYFWAAICCEICAFVLAMMWATSVGVKTVLVKYCLTKSMSWVVRNFVKVFCTWSSVLSMTSCM